MTYGALSAWTDVRVLELRKLHAAGCYSSAGIANALSEKFGIVITRNAVIGKLFRLGLVQTAVKVERAAAPPPRPFTPRIVDTAPRHLTILEVDDTTCKYEVSRQENPALFTFCGHAVFGEVPYCPLHCRIAYEPAKDRRRARVAA